MDYEKPHIIIESYQDEVETVAAGGIYAIKSGPHDSTEYPYKLSENGSTHVIDKISDKYDMKFDSASPESVRKFLDLVNNL